MKKLSENVGRKNRMKYAINAVVVTCNRCELLKQALDALFNQTYILNKIVVINNASTDGTKEYLDSISSEQLVAIHKDINEGGAGGFYYGMKEAYNLGCDFVWIMDDDTICVPDSLEKMMESYEVIRDRNIGFLASNVLYKDASPCFMNICRPDYMWNEFAEEGIIRVTHCSFVAMLVPTWVIKNVGLPIKEYFIWGDDGEYSTRILQKYEGYICAKSKVYHFMDSNVGVDIWNVEENRIERFFYFYRNWMCTHLMRDAQEARDFEKETKILIKEIKKSNTRFKKKKIKVIKKGIREGKKFKVVVKAPDDSVLEAAKSVEGHGFKYKVFRIIRYFLIKYDIKTQGYVTYCKNLYRKYILTERSPIKKIRFLINGLFKTKLYDTGNKVDDMQQLFNECEIKFCNSNYFAYSVDVYKSWKIHNRQMANCSVDYSLLVDSSLDALYMNASWGEYANENNEVIKNLERYFYRMQRGVKYSNLKNKENILRWLGRIKAEKAASLEEALQRVLFVNQLMWQTRHIQIGLGRLDLLLEKFLEDNMSDEYLDNVFCDFLSTLHNYYWMKSEEMPGDTGQIIILSGMDTKENLICNRITYSIIRSVKKCQLPDPKVLLRVTKDTPKDLWKLAIDCISTGIGSPLIANDDIIVNKLIDFGYESEDARNYTTSACWELIPGNSCEQNNIGVFDWAIPFDLIGKKENLDALDTWDKFIWKYSIHLCAHVNFMAHLTDYIVWEKDPLMSFFSASCRYHRKDISEGGCKYNNYGILSVGLANSINSLVNIRKYVYQEKRFSIKEIYVMRNKNFVGHEEVYELLKNSEKHFGDDDEKEDVIGLTNWLIRRVDESIEDFSNSLGGKMKFGLSSPGYIIMGKNNAATFDGRRDGESYSIHISADENQHVTGLLNFAAKLDYGKHGFNGNVVDFTMSPMFIKDNKDKFVALMQGSIVSGVFQIQMNVIDSKTLIEARESPEKFPNLIVRVWGFSAYFKDLPIEYQDYVIERAIKNETINY